MQMTRTKTNPFIAALTTIAFALGGQALAQDAGEDHAASGDAEAKQTEKFVHVKMTTSEGDIVLELNKEMAPISVENFVEYVEEDHYDGLVFHRVIPNFMIQGGGFETSGKQREVRDPIKNEWKNGLKNERGTIAMARTNVPDSATSQFFINVVDNDFLDQPRDGAAYAVFGRVVEGMDTVDKIRRVPTGVKRGMRDWPVENVVIEEAHVMTDEEVEAMKNGGEDDAASGESSEDAGGSED